MLVATTAQGDPATDERRLANRLELWRSFAAKTRHLAARYTATRRSSLLHAPATSAGRLEFTAPGRLLLVDESGGATTRLEGGAITLSVGSRAGTGRAPRTGSPEAWLADVLLGLFAPGSADDLLRLGRLRIPKGRGQRLEFLPALGSEARRVYRSVTVELDAVTGAPVVIVVSESQGDVFELSLSDYRQNEDLAREPSAPLPGGDPAR
jgi:hypothetical protein